MEMIQIPQKEIQSEMFCVNNIYDFIYMIDKLLGSQASNYLAEATQYYVDADEENEMLWKNYYELRDENDLLEGDKENLQAEIKELKEKRHTFTFVFGKE